MSGNVLWCLAQTALVQMVNPGCGDHGFSPIALGHELWEITEAGHCEQIQLKFFSKHLHRESEIWSFMFCAMNVNITELWLVASFIFENNFSHKNFLLPTKTDHKQWIQLTMRWI